MKKILLDTNAYSRFLAKDENVFSVMADADIIYMSIFVLGELYAGFKGGSKEEKNMETLNRFLQKPMIEIPNATRETSLLFGHLKNNLKKAGTPLPINDVWIGAHTMETGSVLITYDRHFQKIPGLRLWENL